MDLNRAQIIGRLTRDPEVRNTPQGATVTSFGVATNFVWTGADGQKQERVEYHNIVAWRKLAEIIGQYCKKGSKVFVEGRLQTREWEGQDGVKRQRTEIVADNLIMLDSRSGGQGSQGGAPVASGMNSNMPNTELPSEGGEMKDKKDDDDITVENIPF